LTISCAQTLKVFFTNINFHTNVLSVDLEVPHPISGQSFK